MTAGASDVPIMASPLTGPAALEAAARRWDDRATLAEMTREDPDVVAVLRRTAAALRLQAATTRPHCSCCLRPLGDHARATA